MTGDRTARRVVVIGAGVVGLAAAAEALDAGAQVTVVDRDVRAVGASVRNFGHVCTTAQAGVVREYALAARQRWLALAAQGVLPVVESGSLLVARAQDELQVLTELAEQRGDEVVLLSRAEVAGRFRDGADVVGGAYFPMDLRVDPRTAVGRIAAWIEGRGVTFRWGVQVASVHAGHVVTSEGVIETDEVVVAVGHDVDTLYPRVAAGAQVRRCSLSMLRVSGVPGRRLTPALMSGLSMLRYGAFASCPGLAAVRERIAGELPEALSSELNLMSTELPDGDLILGDTHHYDVRSVSPFRAESDDRLILEQSARLHTVDSFDVVERWQGVYASAPAPFLVARPDEAVTVLSVTTGVGMTTAFGFVPDALTGRPTPVDHAPTGSPSTLETR